MPDTPSPVSPLPFDGERAIELLCGFAAGAEMNADTCRGLARTHISGLRERVSDYQREADEHAATAKLLRAIAAALPALLEARKDGADAAVRSLAQFGAAVITVARTASVARPLSPELHQAALDAGVFVPIIATERCGPGCACATEGFPHDCLTCPDAIEAAITELLSTTAEGR